VSPGSTPCGNAPTPGVFQVARRPGSYSALRTLPTRLRPRPA